MSKYTFTTPAILTSIKSRVDKSYTVTFSTQELDPTSVGELSQLLQQFGNLAFATNLYELSDLEAPEELFEKGEKTKSERLRGVLYKLWEYQFKEKYPLFDDYYRHTMESIISQFKAKLPPQ